MWRAGPASLGDRELSQGFRLEGNVARFETEAPWRPSANSLERLEAGEGAMGWGEGTD